MVASGGMGASASTTYEAAVERVCDVACERLPHALRTAEGYISEAMRLEETLRTRMAHLPPEQFEPLLHSIFQEDEWKLVAVGGVLGAALGAAQQASFHALGLA